MKALRDRRFAYTAKDGTTYLACAFGSDTLTIFIDESKDPYAEYSVSYIRGQNPYGYKTLKGAVNFLNRSFKYSNKPLMSESDFKEVLGGAE